ncbi:MAG: phosphoesterase [Chlamydiae bacterium]|nr:phosphoesterase [Chlamydiota bacterium]
MKIWSIADLHLCFGTPSKSMEVFGPTWKSYENQIKSNWEASICEDDIVLIPGDISWALRLEEALVDLRWIDKLPGKKVITRGNHDYWWPSSKKLADALPASIFFIHNNALCFEDIAIAGTRLWDSSEFSFNEWIDFQEPIKTPPKPKDPLEDEKIFLRELERLTLSLEAMDKKAKYRIAMLHYPPIGAIGLESVVSKILTSYNIDVCVFGHLHNIKEGIKLDRKLNGVSYYCVSADHIRFKPVKVLDTQDVKSQGADQTSLF